jgi:hypothetical protein
MYQLLEGLRGTTAMINSLQQACPEQLSKPQRIELVALIAVRDGVPGVADYEVGDQGAGQFIQPLSVAAFLKREMDLTA